ncbi:phospholipase D family protein [Marivita sp. S0852]|uniref:phospholipase D family protein n=1 Tax=Marivita sp. S0852 TaxID=3373893 RepID=UPI0039822BAD
MPDDFEVLITANEAWPAFERAVLNARQEVIAGFRIFDMRTKLRSAEARKIGDDWFDLLAHVANNGVSVDLTVSDFDPVVGTDLHKMAWSTVRQGKALAEIVNADAGAVSVRAHLHPAQAGALPWISLLPAVLKRRSSRLSALDPDERTRQAVGLDLDDLPQIYTVTHHQKLAVIDGEILYLGGLDLNERRWDTQSHDLPASETWSDVQVLMRGPEAAEARAHLQTFAQACAGTRAPSKAQHLKRTLSAPRRLQFPFISPRSVLTEIETAHFDAFKRARRQIYIETQFFRSSRIANALADAAAQNSDLQLMVILPSLPEELAIHDQSDVETRYGMALQKAAMDIIRHGFENRLTLATPVRPSLAARDTKKTLCGSAIIHVHNKVLIADDDFVLIGSANLNGRSLRWDTEVAISTDTPARVAHARQKLFQHWWFDALPAEAMNVVQQRQWWHDQIARNGVARPENRTGFLVPHDPANHADMAQPLPGVTEDLV